MDSSSIVGREPELAVLSDHVGAGGPLVLTGAPGIGKTTLWEAGIEAARSNGLQVLSASPSDGEARCPSRR